MSKRKDRRRKEQRRRAGNLGKGLFYVTSEPLEVSPRLPPEVEDAIPDLFEGTRERPAKTLERVEQLIAKYPNVPTLYNYRAVSLASLGERERHEEVVEENFRRHPDYVFARVNYAERLLDRGDPDSVAAVPGIFGGTFDLRRMYPHRTIFHTSEFASVSFVEGKYCLLTGDIKRAQDVLEFMQEAVPDHAGTAELSRLLTAARIRATLARLDFSGKGRKRRA